MDFLYFSFVTMTTVGFGDLTPGTDAGRVRRHVRSAHRSGVPRDARRAAGEHVRRERPSRRRDDGTYEPVERPLSGRRASLSGRASSSSELDAVERGALAQVVAGGPEVEGVLLRRVFADPARRAPGRSPPPPWGWARRRRRRRAARRARPRAARRASARDIGRSNCTFTRDAVPDVHGHPHARGRCTWISGAWRILRVSRTIFHSSDV